MNATTPKTFRDLFDTEDFHGVEIPIIQRDYAQGRTTASDVRRQFIDALHEALHLPSDSPRLPLDLDFIYGSMDESDLGTVFSPLDGQQRLTALFLLHWYLAAHDGRMDDFQSFMCRDGCQSRFSYKVRASADEFFDTLANTPFELPEAADEADGAMTRVIEDQPWFFLAWRQDPTVASALQVLDTIHEKFHDTTGLYDRLVVRDTPVITFQFLNLPDFGLSDELYIKMNARGKALTEFEAFKARLQQKIDTLLKSKTYEYGGQQVTPKEYFAHRVDGTWAEVFWHKRREGSRTFDAEFMNFVRGLVIVTFPYAKRDADATQVDLTMRSLYKHSEHYHFYRYDQEKCLTSDFAEMLISVLDQLYAVGGELKQYLPGHDYYDEEAMFKRVLLRAAPERPEGLSYSEWVKFYGYCIYLYKYEPEPGDERFNEWMRLVSNLALNTIFNRATDFIRAQVGLREFLDRIGSGSPLEYVADPANTDSVMNQQQWREEKIKAQLMIRDSRWSPLIMIAEKHGYFEGQIEFLLDASGILTHWLDVGACDWSDDEDETWRAAFAAQYEKSNAIFDEKGLRTFEDAVWERTILTFGDYFLPNGRNLSLLDNSDRTASWKRLLRGSDQPEDALAQKRTFVRSAMAVVDAADPQGSLSKHIEAFLASPPSDDTDEWRRLLVECPEAIAYCRQRFLRNVGQNGVFLMAKTRTSAYHAELHTYHLAHVVLPGLQEQGELQAFTEINDHPVCYEDRLPSVDLVASSPGVLISVRYQLEHCQLRAELMDECPEDVIASICGQEMLFRCAEDSKLAGKCVAHADLIPALQRLSDTIESLSSEGAS
jgi:hypothetical protein